jgi:hypothetical protein
MFSGGDTPPNRRHAGAEPPEPKRRQDMKTVQNKPITQGFGPAECQEASVRGNRTRPPRRVLFVMGACLLLGLALGVNLNVPVPAEKAAPTLAPALSTNTAHHGRPGPWGDLEYTRIFIEPPDGFVVGAIETQASWFFKGYSREQVEALFQSAGLAPEQLQALMAARWTNSADGGVTVMPGNDVILGLSPEARGKIYNILGAYSENPAQFNTYRYLANHVDEWFFDSGLRPELVKLLTSLVYRRGNFWAFSDFGAVASQLVDDKEEVRLCKTLARRSTMFISLCLSPDSDINSLADYWGQGGRSKDVLTLLTSLKRQKDGASIDIVHLLPRLARTLLYTYPWPAADSAEPQPDCHWTSLNFFRRVPNNAFAGTEAVNEAFAKEYRPVNGEPMLGDIVGFVTSDQKMVHSCVYVADDIVFTKNGVSWDMPWILVRLEDLISLYAATTPIGIVRFRAVNAFRADTTSSREIP